MSRDEVWRTYISSMALLAKAEARTAEAREAVAAAEADEEALRQSIEQARVELEVIARQEAGALWVNFEDWAMDRSQPAAAPSVLKMIDRVRSNGHAANVRAE